MHACGPGLHERHQLNGHPLEPHKEFFVQDGDLVRFGDADFAFFLAKSLHARLLRTGPLGMSSEAER